MSRKIVVIVGPTTSGKSARAIEIAGRVGGEIVNADSVQLYEDLKILSARPSIEDEARFKHHLYGIKPYFEKTNMVDYAISASEVVKSILKNGNVPIVVGGTGLYVKTLLDGYVDMPAVSNNTRQAAAELAKQDYEKLCEIVFKNDIRTIEKIGKQRHRQMIRAYEILLETGHSILDYQSQQPIKLLSNINIELIKILPTLNDLQPKIEQRFAQMLDAGALKEVEALLHKTSGNTSYPIYDAIGVKELSRYLLGNLKFDEAVKLSTVRTRQYAKRQLTWFKNQSAV